MYSESGSSPLARGLPAVDPCDEPPVRIIPARAGFTRDPSREDVGPPDHPRSRGVYCRACRRVRVRTGSSPLARGLPAEHFDISAATGIIPARAGFTFVLQSSSVHEQDHPRSRGVYASLAAAACALAGSSPLARGLHGPRGTRSPTTRIIPARAGFTRPMTALICVGPDHPRSRGVYRSVVRRGRFAVGSSPLARGLPILFSYLRLNVGIIPARAGFTRALSPPARGPPDHPRSRGVYPSIVRSRSSRRGSSPLARGLRVVDLPLGEDGRIIPARAGFTSSAVSRSGCSRDHPRSRGVYFSAAIVSEMPAGSSPLARGLPEFGNGATPTVGIIPARAGFTSSPA